MRPSNRIIPNNNFSLAILWFLLERTDGSETAYTPGEWEHSLSIKLKSDLTERIEINPNCRAFSPKERGG